MCQFRRFDLYHCYDAQTAELSVRALVNAKAIYLMGVVNNTADNS